MELAAAKRAGEIASSIDARTRLRASVEQAIAGGWAIVEVLARDPASGEMRSLIVGQLDAPTSATGLAFIKSIYDAELTALEADLATAETWTP